MHQNLTFFTKIVLTSINYITLSNETLQFTYLYNAKHNNLEFDGLYIQITMVKERQQEQSSQSQNAEYQLINKSFKKKDLNTKFLKFKINKYNAFSVEILLIGILKTLPIVHTLITYLLLSQNHLNDPLKDLLDTICGNGIMSIFIKTFNYSIKFLQVISVGIPLWYQQNTILIGFSKRIICNFNILVEIDLILSSIFLLGNFEQNVGGFIFATISYFFYTIFLVNYFDRKDVLYVFSIRDNIFYNSIIIGTFLVNSIFSQFFNLQLYTFIDFSISITLFIWYIKNGFLMIPHQSLKFFLQGTIIIKMAISLIFLDIFFLQTSVQVIDLSIKLALISAVIYFVCKILHSSLYLFQSLLQQSSQGRVKHFDVFLTSILEQTLGNMRQRQFFIICMLNRKMQNKDPSKAFDFHGQQTLRTHKHSQQAELRVHMRSIYLQSYERNPQDINLLLDFCQFILNEFNNPFEICKLIRKINLSNIGYIQHVRLCRLRLVLEESNSSFNQIVFGGRMEIQNMIIAEGTFDEITTSIQTIISLELKIWEAIAYHTINLTQVRRTIENKLKLLKETSNRWSSIAKYLRFQKRWRYIFMNYTFFLLNQRLYYKDTQQFKNFHEDNYFLGQSTFLFQNDARDKLFNEALLFDKKSFYIRAYMNNDIMQIIKVSRYFQNFVEYSQTEIIGSPVHLLMPQQFKWTHDDKVIAWLQSGSCTNETLYNARFTSFLTKEGEEIPAVKYYKLFIDIYSQNMLQFVCLLKVNQEEHPIDDEDLELQASLSVTSKVINKDFNTSNRNTFKQDNNIFIKDDNLKTNEKIIQIQQAKKSIRFLTLCIVSIIIMLLFVTKNDTTTINANITQFLNFLNLYRFPMALSKNYMKNFLNIGSQKSVISQIALGTQNFLAFNSDPLTLKTLFDESLNVPRKYLPFLNDSFNLGIEYDQVQIYSIIISSITSLSKLPINRTGYDFTMLNMYLIPSYDHMINATKIKFHETFQANLERMLVDQVIVGLVQGSIFMVIIIFVAVKISKYFKKGRNILQIVFDFSQSNIMRIQKYWKNLLKHFQKLHLKNKVYCLQTVKSIRATKNYQIDLDIQIIRLKLQKQQNISCNKRQKNIFQTKKAKGKMTKYLIVIIISLLLLIMGLLSIQISNIVQIKHLQAFQTDGFYFLRYFPATSVLGHALMQRYYYQIYPKQVKYDPSRYAEYISDMYLIGQSPYIGTQVDPTSIYYQKRKNYMFGNPCTFAPQVLTAASSNMTACLTAYNKTLSNGITTLLRASYPQLQMYLNQKINLTTAQLNDITTSLTLVAYFVTDAITTWASQFSSKVTHYQNLDTTLCIIAVSIVLVLHVVFCQNFLFFFLETDYNFIRQIFDKMIPNFIISIEKVIRQKFVMEGIIKQS